MLLVGLPIPMLFKNQNQMKVYFITTRIQGSLFEMIDHAILRTALAIGAEFDYPRHSYFYVLPSRNPKRFDTARGFCLWR